MSNEKTIDEAIYDLGIEGIEPRRKSPATDIIITLAGALVFGLSFTAANPDLKSGLSLCGILILITGLIMLCSTFSGKGKPYYRPASQFLKRYEIKTDTTRKEDVRRAVSEGDLESLGEIPPARPLP